MLRGRVEGRVENNKLAAWMAGREHWWHYREAGHFEELYWSPEDGATARFQGRVERLGEKDLGKLTELGFDTRDFRINETLVLDVFGYNLRGLASECFVEDSAEVQS